MGEKERILLAEDDKEVREMLETILTIEGHEVVAEATTVGEVEAAVDDPDKYFRIAILDGRMPNQGDGEIAAAYIRAHRPGTVIISLSADTENFGDYNILKGLEPEILMQTIKEV